MTWLIRPPRLRPTVLALAVMAAFSGAQAQDSHADGSITFGLGLSSGDSAERALYGQYNGLRDKRAAGLLGGEFYRVDEAAGTSLLLRGSDVLGRTRELDLRWKKPGDWKFGASYREQVRQDPNTVSTGTDLSMKRTGLGLSFAKIIDPRWQVNVSLSSENKSGDRLFGIGFSCPSAVAPGCRGTTGTETGWAVLMQPEPINANHSQVDARVSYAGQALRLSLGYHGSFYRNAYGSLSPSLPATLNNAVGTPLPPSAGLMAILSQPVALAPDNQSHQFDIAGNYTFTPTTQLTFKLAHSQNLQNQDFAAAGLSGAPSGIQNLGGRMDTTLAQVGLTARPIPKLSLAARLRYEDRDDLTPIALYNVEDTATYTNRRLPLTKWRGQLQAHYQFTSDYRGTLEAQNESIDRGVFTATSAVAGISALRQKTDETTVRAELRRRMNEDISGSISLASSRRDGSNWLKDNSGRGVTEVGDPSDPATGLAAAIFMPTLADRQRDTVKLLADWQPTEALSLQLAAQGGRDRFKTPSVYGLRSAGNDLLSLDATYAVSERWNVTGYVSHSEETLRQARPGAAIMDYDNRSTTLSLGVSGKPKEKIEVGGGLSFIDDRSTYAQTLEATADAASTALLAATGGLPDIVFRQTRLSLFGRYELSKRSAVRLDFVHQRSTWTDWAWGYGGMPFTYSDGTTVVQKPVQHVTFVGVTYSLAWL